MQVPRKQQRGPPFAFPSRRTQHVPSFPFSADQEAVESIAAMNSGRTGSHVG